MALGPPDALPALTLQLRGAGVSHRGPHPPGVRPRTRGCPRGGDVLLPPRADSAGGGWGITPVLMLLHISDRNLHVAHLFATAL